MGFFGRRDKDAFTLYINGRPELAIRNKKKNRDSPLDFNNIALSKEGETLESWFKERKAWAKENDPNYYVHPRYWYEPEPGECGQGYRYEVEAYYEHLAERRQDRLSKIKTKLPLIGFIAIIMGILLHKVLR